MPARVIVDSNEPDDIYEALKDLLESVDKRRLMPCDYLIGGQICVERKTVRDFLNSVFDGRIFDQVARMLETYESAVVVIEGVIPPLTPREERILAGAIAGIVKMGASVVSVRDKEQTAWFIASLAREGRRGPVVAKRRPKLASMREVQLYVLTSIPGIGPKSATALLKRFKTLQRIFQASLPELRSVVGEKRAEKIKQVLEARYDSEESVRAASLE